MFSSFLRIVRFSWQDVVRNWWLSLATIVMLVVAIFSVDLVFVWTATAGHAVTTLEEKVDVSLFMDPSVKELDVHEVRTYIRQLPGVRDVAYISRDEALANFRARHADDPVILASLDELEENPFGAELVLAAENLDAYPRIIEKITSSPYNTLIKEKSFRDHAAVMSRLAAAIGIIQRVGLLTSVLFALVSLLIVFNTIRIIIYTHQAEIGIMKRVGATNWFTRTPFLVESILLGVVALCIATGLFFVFLGAIRPYIADFFSESAFDVQAYFLHNAWKIFGAELIAVVAFTGLSALIAVRRYLRV